MDAELKKVTVTDDLDGVNSNIVAAIFAAAENSGYLQIRKPSLDISKPRWFDSECSSMKHSMNQSLRFFRRSRFTPSYAPTALSAFQKNKTAYRNLCLEKEDKYLLNQESKLHNLNNPRHFWEAYKSLKIRPPATKNRISPNSWHQHFTSVFNPEVQPTFPAPDFTKYNNADEILDHAFNTFEIRIAIKRLKNKKAPGPDKIPNEVWKVLNSPSANILVDFFQKILDMGKVPKDWCEVLICPLHKKGPTDVPSNFRPISLLNTVLKIFTSIMNTRLNSWVKKYKKISEFQAGFQKGRSTMDHVFVLNSIIQTQLIKKKCLYACFVDLSQAFDTPNHNLLWTRLLEMGVSNKYVTVFQNIYSQAFAKVRAGSELTEEIDISKGVLQGESASPTIFNLSGRFNSSVQ
jgi:hypothetical protein